MYKFNIILIFALMILFTACSKDDVADPLPNGSISFQLAAGKDTLEMPLSILKDSVIVLAVKAALSGSASSDEHWVSFAVDTTKMIDYRAKYGSALLMPPSSYVFNKATTRIAAGASVSDSAMINIGLQTRLTEYSTYVLPIVIQSVDGKVEGAATTRVIYFVFKTGKPLTISKSGWTIGSFSSQQGTFVPTNLIDANVTGTYWASNITMVMPQWVIINFNRDVTFTALTYTLPAILVYPTLGGYPTSMQIETSMNGTTWVNKGVFAGNIINKVQTIDVGGITTARFLRFTFLAAVKYANLYDAVFISDISLLP